MIGTSLAWGLALGLLAMGIGTLPFPEPLSRVYGAPVTDAAGRAFVRATGLRDVVLGGLLVGLLAVGDARGAALVCAGTAALALGDFALVSASRGRAAAASLGVHGSGLAMAGLATALLVAGV